MLQKLSLLNDSVIQREHLDSIRHGMDGDHILVNDKTRLNK